MKNKKLCIIGIILTFVFIFQINGVTAFAYTESDCVISEVKIMEEGQVLGYGDVLHMSCKIDCPYTITKVWFGIATKPHQSSILNFELKYNESSNKYENNLILQNNLLESAYKTWYVSVFYDMNGTQVEKSVFSINNNFVQQDFVFNNNCKNNNHSYDNGTITKPATCQYEGIKTYICSVCSASKTESISKTSHTIVIDNEIPATYTKNGLTEGSHCSVCGMIMEAQKSIPKLPKKEQKITVKKNNYTFKAKSLKNKNTTFVIKSKVIGKCKLKYTIEHCPKNTKKYISVNKLGKVTLKKGIKKGKYIISITAAASKEYTKAVKTITITIK